MLPPSSMGLSITVTLTLCILPYLYQVYLCLFQVYDPEVSSMYARMDDLEVRQALFMFKPRQAVVVQWLWKLLMYT